MSDRPDYDPEKNFEIWRKNWDRINFEVLAKEFEKKKSYFLDELVAMEARFEEKLELIENQIQALFQLSEKFLNESMDHMIDSDVNDSKFRIIDTRLKVLEQAKSEE